MPAECRSNQPIVPGRPLRCTWPRVVTRHRASAPARAAAKPRRGAHRHHGRTSSSDALLRVRGCSGHVHGSRLRKAVRRDPWSELVLVRSRSSCTVDRESQYECEDQFPCFEPRALGAAGSGTTDAAAVAGWSQHAKLRSRCCGPAGRQKWSCRTGAPGPETECGPNRLSSEPARCVRCSGATGK